MLVVAARELLLKYLEQEDTVYGICDYLYRVDKTSHGKIQALALDWPQHSGVMEFPVPHYKKCPRAAYASCSNMLEDTPYGNERRNLVRFLLDKLAKYEGTVSLEDVSNVKKIPVANI